MRVFCQVSANTQKTLETKTKNIVETDTEIYHIVKASKKWSFTLHLRGGKKTNLGSFIRDFLYVNLLKLFKTCVLICKYVHDFAEHVKQAKWMNILM